MHSSRLILTCLLAPLLALCWLVSAHAQAVLDGPLQVERTEDALLLAYSLKLDLPPAVDDALHKGVALYFVAEAKVTRPRWYWRDTVLARGDRSWRLSYQALTRQYRVSNGGLSQSHERLSDALASVRRASRWTLPLREDPLPGANYDIEFSLRLDTSQLPGPLQIGLGSGVSIGVSQTRRLHPMELGLAS